MLVRALQQVSGGLQKTVVTFVDTVGASPRIVVDQLQKAEEG